METSEIKEKLKCSLEIAHIRSALVVASVLVAAYVGIMTLFWGNIAFTVILCGVFFLLNQTFISFRFSRQSFVQAPQIGVASCLFGTYVEKVTVKVRVSRA